MSEAKTTSGRFKPRPQRVPLHEQRSRLTVNDKDPNRVYRVVNDVDNRIDKFKEGGYRVESVNTLGDPSVDGGNDNTGSAVVKHVGQGVKGVLMSIDKDWYEADQVAKQTRVDEMEAAMKRDALNKSDYGDLKIRRGSV